MEFEYPEIIQPKEEKDKEQKKEMQTLDEMENQFKKYCERNKERKGLPGWFSI